MLWGDESGEDIVEAVDASRMILRALQQYVDRVHGAVDRLVSIAMSRNKKKKKVNITEATAMGLIGVRSVQRCVAEMEAYMTGLESALSADKDVSEKLTHYCHPSYGNLVMDGSGTNSGFTLEDCQGLFRLRNSTVQLYDASKTLLEHVTTRESRTGMAAAAHSALSTTSGQEGEAGLDERVDWVRSRVDEFVKSKNQLATEFLQHLEQQKQRVGDVGAEQGATRVGTASQAGGPNAHRLFRLLRFNTVHDPSAFANSSWSGHDPTATPVVYLGRADTAPSGASLPLW